MRAVIYCRISRDPGHDELGVRRQEQDCRRLCERSGYELAEVLIDDDRSAYSGKRRPGYQRAMDLIRTGQAGVLVAWHPDRITRHPRELEDLIDLLQTSAATVHTVQSGEYDLSTESGRMTARIVGAVARGESEHKSARLRRKHLELAEAGKVSGGGDRPFGYQADRVTIDEVEAAEVRAMVAHVLAGGSFRSLAADLNARGVTTTAGMEWRAHKVRVVLTSPRIAGLRVHRGQIAGEAIWPGIISVADHHRVRAIVAGRPAPRPPRRYVLVGLLHCSSCGGRMVARPRADGARSYVCASDTGGCGKRRTLADPLEQLVVDAVLERLAGVVPAVDEAGAVDVSGRLAQLDARTAELGEMWAAGEIDRAGWRAARIRLDAERAELAKTVAAEGRRSGMVAFADVDDLAAAWDGLDIERRRQLLGEVIDRVTLGPAVKGRNRFDPERVSVTWIA